MPEEKTLFVINPISGDIDKNELTTEISKFMEAGKVPFEFFNTTGKNDKEKILGKIEALNPDTVVAIGGDGTCNLLGQTLLGKPVKMGIIPAGSANGMAAELGLPANIKDCLKIVSVGKTKSIDVLRINRKHLSLHLSDLGFNARIINTYEEGEMRGLLGYAKSFIDEFGNAGPAKFEIRYDDKTITKEAFMIVLANASQFGTGAIINPQGKPDDGYFEIVVVRPQNFMNFLEMLVPFYTRRIHTLDFVDIYKCQHAEIKNLQNQNLQIDGENIGQPLQVDVEILPRSLTVVVP